MPKIKSIIDRRRRPFTPSGVAFLGVYLGLIIALKYMFGFVPGIELITFMFMMAGIFFPLYEGLILVVAFNAIMVALYGWGAWQIMYWIIWPFDLITTKILSKVTRNKYVFSFWGFILGFLVAFWYFISDAILFDTSYAIVNVVSAIPVNLIEGFTTSFFILVCGSTIGIIFARTSKRVWDVKKVFKFRDAKGKYSQHILIVVNIIFVASIISLFLLNNTFLDLKENLMSVGRATKIK